MLNGLADWVDHAHKARQAYNSSFSLIAIEFVGHQLGPALTDQFLKPFFLD
jgi:hypothetical protein